MANNFKNAVKRNISADSTLPTTIYSAPDSKKAIAIEIDVANSSTSFFKVSVPNDDGLYVVLPGVSVHNGKLITAFAGTTNVIKIVGYVEQHI